MITASLRDPARAHTPGTRRPRLGFLGVGWIGRQRMEALAAAGAAQVAVVADAQMERAMEAAAAFEGARVVAGLEEMLQSGVNGIVVATPSALHAEQCRAALDAGLAVFCQKPLARTAAETLAIVERAARADRLLGVDLSYRWTEAMRHVRGLVRGGTLGTIYAVELVFHNAYGPDKRWFYDRKLSGGGCVIDLGIHLVDLALWTLGFPAVRETSGRLYAGGQALPRGAAAVEDFATAQLLLDGGTTVRLACSWRLPAGCDAVIEATFYGTRGAARFRNVAGSFYDFTAEHLAQTRGVTLCAPPDAWGGRALVDWAQRLAGGERFDASSWRYVQLARVLDAIYGR